MIERQTQRLYLCYWSANPMKLHLEFQDGGHLEFSRWPLFKPNFAHNSKTKHDRKAKSKATPRFLGSTNPLKLFSEFQGASPTQHGIAESARDPWPSTGSQTQHGTPNLAWEPARDPRPVSVCLSVCLWRSVCLSVTLMWTRYLVSKCTSAYQICWRYAATRGTGSYWKSVTQRPSC